MILFARVRENLTTLGIAMYQPGLHISSQLGEMKFLILIFFNFWSYIIYAFHEAYDFMDLVNTVFALLAFFSVFNFTWNAKHIYELLNNIEETIKARKRVALVFTP